MTSEQQHEEELREGASIGLTYVLGALAHEGEDSQHADKARLGMGLLSRHNGYFSARNKKAEVLIAAAKLVRANGDALAEVIRVALPQVPLLAAAASGQATPASLGRSRQASQRIPSASASKTRVK